MSAAKLKQAEEKYGKVDTFISRLKELAEQGDLRFQDVQETLRDVNFILAEADENLLTFEELIQIIPNTIVEM